MLAAIPVAFVWKKDAVELVLGKLSNLFQQDGPPISTPVSGKGSGPVQL
jgi:hypothetical protein